MTQLNDSIRRFLLCFLALVLLPGLTYAQDRGLIWQFSKDDQVSYLLGSVHFANSSFYPLPKSILQAYDSSSVLIVEVDDARITPEEQQRLMLKYGTYPNNEKIYDHLSRETVAGIRKLFNEFRVPLSQLDNYRPGLLAMTLTALQAQKLGYNSEQGIDRYFMQKARFKKTIRQIEDFEFQMSLLSKLPEEDGLLQDSFNNMEDFEKHWEGTMSAWKIGDEKALYDLAIGEPMSEYPSLEAFFDVLFFARHDKMTHTATQCISNKEVCFIVVGAGHLVGDKGVIAELKRLGYAVKQL